MSLVNKFGDFYHKNIFRPIAKGTSKITDSTKFAFSDPILGGTLFLQEMVVGLSGYLIYNMLTDETHSISYQLGAIITGIGMPVGTALLTYGFNGIRTPLENRIGLKIPEELDEEKEVEYTIKRLNELSESPILSFDQINDRVNKSIDDFVLKTEGYEVPHAKRTKKSIFSKYLIRRGCMGLMNPFFQEIVVTSDFYPETIAHEKAHLVGYARENEAQFVSYASMVKSDDQSLQYLAYFQRMDMLINNDIVELEELEERGLNNKTFSQIKDRDEYFKREIGKNSRYRKFLNSIGKSVRSLMLKSFGQGNIEEAYLGKPLLMISAFDTPVD